MLFCYGILVANAAFTNPVMASVGHAFVIPSVINAVSVGILTWVLVGEVWAPGCASRDLCRQSASLHLGHKSFNKVDAENLGGVGAKPRATRKIWT